MLASLASLPGKHGCACLYNDMVHMLAALPSPVCVRGWYVKNVWSRAKRKTGPLERPRPSCSRATDKIESSTYAHALPDHTLTPRHTMFSQRQDGQSVARPGRVRVFALRCVRGTCVKLLEKDGPTPIRAVRATLLNSTWRPERRRWSREALSTLVASAALIFTELFL